MGLKRTQSSISLLLNLYWACFIVTHGTVGSSSCIYSPPTIAKEQPIAYVGERVTCVCTACSGQKILWFLNGTKTLRLSGDPFNAYSEYIETDARVINRLFFDASPEASNSVIKCGVLGGEYSPTITIPIQGLLRAPNDLTGSIDDDSLTLTWTPLFSYSEILQYVVEITVPGQFKVTTNTSQPSYQLIFSEIGISRCKSTEIMFSVYGHNSVGNGEFSNITFTLPHGDQMCGSIETTSTEVPQPLTTSPQSEIPDDIVLYISLIPLLILTAAIILAVAIAICVCMRLNNTKRSKKSQTEPTPPDKTSLHLNVAYTMPKNQVEMKVNDAYAVPPYPANVSTEVHHYDIVLQPVYATIGPRQMKYRESQSA